MLARHHHRFLKPLSTVSLYIHRPRHARLFHPSPPNHGFIDLSHTVFQNVHTFLDVSWPASIAVTAFLFRLSFAPVLLLASSLGNKRRVSVQPLLLANKNIIEKQVKSQVALGKMTQRSDTPDHNADELASQRQMGIEARYKLVPRSLSTLVSLAFLPVWIINVGVLQSMCDSQHAFLPYFVDPSNLPPPESGFDSSLTRAGLFLSLDPTESTLMLAPAYLAISFDTIRRKMTPEYLGNLRDFASKVIAAPKALTSWEAATLAAVGVPVLIPLLSVPSLALWLYLFWSAAAQNLISTGLDRIADLRKPSAVAPAKAAFLKPHLHAKMHQLDVFTPFTEETRALLPAHTPPQATSMPQQPQGPRKPRATPSQAPKRDSNSPPHM